MDLNQKLQSLLETAAANGEIAGANVLVLKNGEQIAYAQAGCANVEKQLPYNRDTIARLYSMSKPVTAAAAMLLVERGQLDLGQNLGDIIPEFRNPQVWENGKKVPARRGILVRDLLNMTSGIPYPAEDPAGQAVARVFDGVCRGLSDGQEVSTVEFARQIGDCGLSFHPGEKWMYGSSADVLGAVIEAVSGMTFGEFLRTELFEPLGMVDTGFYVPPEKQPRLAEVYERSPQGMRRSHTQNLGIRYSQAKPPKFESGGAGLVSTLDDYARFASMLLSGGQYQGKQLMAPKTVEYLTRGKLMPWQQESLWKSWESMYGYGYGNLMRVMEEPGMAYFNTWKGEYGWDGWLGCYFCNSPENGVTVLISCQRTDAGTMEITRRVRNVIAACV